MGFIQLPGISPPFLAVAAQYFFFLNGRRRHQHWLPRQLIGLAAINENLLIHSVNVGWLSSFLHTQLRFGLAKSSRQECVLCQRTRNSRPNDIVRLLELASPPKPPQERNPTTQESPNFSWVWAHSNHPLPPTSPSQQGVELLCCLVRITVGTLQQVRVLEESTWQNFNCPFLLSRLRL